MKWRLVLGFAALVVIGGAALFFVNTEVTSEYVFSPNPVFSEELKTIFIGDSKLRVAVADSTDERMQGLSGTKYLPDGTGLLFVFESDDRPGFWMKDMLFPIDIIWISAQGEVVGIEENVSPDSYPSVFSPIVPVRYVLEVPGGFSAENHIQKTSKISVEIAL